MIKAVLFDCFGVALDVNTNQKLQQTIDFIASLKNQYKLAMVSNVSNRESIERHFAEDELDQLFDIVIPSGEVGYEKPQPEIYELAAQQLGVAVDECLFIDDIPRFAEAATVVGMHAIVFVDPEFSVREIKEYLEKDAYASKN